MVPWHTGIFGEVVHCLEYFSGHFKCRDEKSDRVSAVRNTTTKHDKA